MACVRHLEFKNKSYLFRYCHRVPSVLFKSNFQDGGRNFTSVIRGVISFSPEGNIYSVIHIYLQTKFVVLAQSMT